MTEGLRGRPLCGRLLPSHAAEARKAPAGSCKALLLAAPGLIAPRSIYPAKWALLLANQVSRHQGVPCS